MKPWLVARAKVDAVADALAPFELEIPATPRAASSATCARWRSAAGSGSPPSSRSSAAAAPWSFETATAQMKRYSAVKSPVELIQLNGEFAKTSFDATVAELS